MRKEPDCDYDKSNISVVICKQTVNQGMVVAVKLEIMTLA